jgi:hypothetical protein
MNHQLQRHIAMDARHECLPRPGVLARIAFEDLPAQTR